jgi:hypothetical protein
MPGRKTNYDNTYLTALLTYRTAITVADPTPDAEAIPAIRVDIDTSKQAISADATEQRWEVSSRAYNAHLELYVQYTPGTDCTEAPASLIDGLLGQEDVRCHADILVWAWGEPYDQSVPGKWCLVHEQSVVADTLMVLRDIPNTKYKVTVSFMNGTGGSVNILEQHTV